MAKSEEHPLERLHSLSEELRVLLGRLSPADLAVVSHEPSEEMQRRLLQVEQRAIQAEAMVVKLRQRLEKDTRQSEASAQELNRLAFQDSLTGLANANLILEHLNKSIAGLVTSRQLLVVVVDLDHFSTVNQMLGHEHGDDLLIRVSERLLGLVSEHGGAVGRLSEDEFALTLSVTTAQATEKAIAFAEEVRACINAPFMLQGQRIPLTVSQGGALAQGEGDSGKEILHRAQTALAHAKKNGRNQFHLYNPEFERQLRRSATMEFQLGFALEGDELFLEYLPVVWLDELPGGGVQGRLLGVEALLRWRHRGEGVIPATDFIEAAERSGRVVAIGRQMFEVACRDFAQWRQAGADLFLYFNLSGRELLEPEVALVMAEIADRYKIPRDRVTFEVSENCPTLDAGIIEAGLEALSKEGFTLALDGFGSGAFSLRRLSQVQFLKLSRQLLQGDVTLIDKALSLARGLGLVTIGVGAETAEQVQFLVSKGCLGVQGFYFSQPLEAGEISRLHRSKPGWAVPQ